MGPMSLSIIIYILHLLKFDSWRENWFDPQSQETCCHDNELVIPLYT